MKKNVFISTRNVKTFYAVAESLQTVEAGVPGMGLIYGDKGLGKTSAAIHYACQKNNNAIYVRAKRDWSYTWMMDELLIEMAVTTLRGAKAKFDALVSALVEQPRLVIVDETNTVAPALLETLRGVHDLTHNPFLFIGHEGIKDLLMRLGPFYDRLLYKGEMNPLGLEDLESYCATALEVTIDSKTVAAVLEEAGGNFRRSVIRLKKLEDFAKLQKAAAIEHAMLTESA